MVKERSALGKNRIISWRAIREFIEAHPEDQSAPDAFAKWYDLVRENRFTSFNEVRRTFPSRIWWENLLFSTSAPTDTGSLLGSSTRRGRVYILRVLTHSEYDRGDWKE